MQNHLSKIVNVFQFQLKCIEQKSYSELEILKNDYLERINHILPSIQINRNLKLEFLEEVEKKDLFRSIIEEIIAEGQIQEIHIEILCLFLYIYGINFLFEMMNSNIFNSMINQLLYINFLESFEFFKHLVRELGLLKMPKNQNIKRFQTYLQEQPKYQLKINYEVTPFDQTYLDLINLVNDCSQMQINALIQKIPQLKQLLFLLNEKKLFKISSQIIQYFENEITQFQYKIESENQQNQLNEFYKNHKNELFRNLSSIRTEIELLNRQIFVENERIDVEESLQIEFKYFNQSLTKKRKFIIKKVVCSFFNSCGGFLFIGITDNRDIIGYDFQNQQALYDEIISCIECLDPKPLINYDFKLDFLPIYNIEGLKYQNKIIIRIQIIDHQNQDVYTFMEKNEELEVDSILSFERCRDSSKFIKQEALKQLILNKGQQSVISNYFQQKYEQQNIQIEKVQKYNDPYINQNYQYNNDPYIKQNYQTDTNQLIVQNQQQNDQYMVQNYQQNIEQQIFQNRQEIYQEETKKVEKIKSLKNNGQKFQIKYKNYNNVNPRKEDKKHKPYQQQIILQAESSILTNNKIVNNSYSNNESQFKNYNQGDKILSNNNTFAEEISEPKNKIDFQPKQFLKKQDNTKAILLLINFQSGFEEINDLIEEIKLVGKINETKSLINEFILIEFKSLEVLQEFDQFLNNKLIAMKYKDEPYEFLQAYPTNTLKVFGWVEEISDQDVEMLEEEINTGLNMYNFEIENNKTYCLIKTKEIKAMCPLYQFLTQRYEIQWVFTESQLKKSK